MDELVVAWGAAVTRREGRLHLARSVRAVTGLDVTTVRCCWSCGSVEHGAPYLADGWDSYIGCSVTHVPGFTLAAISLRRDRDGSLRRAPLPVGIDAEAVSASVPDLAPALARRILSASEVERLRTGSAEAIESKLLAAWTQKEATLKAVGCGLTVDPRQVQTAPIGRGHTRVRLPGADGAFVARPVEVDSGRSWVVSVVTPDVPRAQWASLRIVHVP